VREEAPQRRHDERVVRLYCRGYPDSAEAADVRQRLITRSVWKDLAGHLTRFVSARPRVGSGLESAKIRSACRVERCGWPENLVCAGSNPRRSRQPWERGCGERHRGNRGQLAHSRTVGTTGRCVRINVRSQLRLNVPSGGRQTTSCGTCAALTSRSPPRHLPDRAAPSFTALLRQDGGGGLSPALGS